MTEPDRLAKIKRDDDLGLEIGRSDFDWLVGEVERLREETRTIGSANLDWAADNARLRGLLARLEWACHGDCPACGGNKMHEFSKLTPGGHDPGCWLAAELRPEGDHS